ncbi:MAG TPA: GTPase Era, partial [Chloroflexi bacterium]|nr:GTPase Era [Chloroflexota bacterium]
MTEKETSDINQESLELIKTFLSETGATPEVGGDALDWHTEPLPEDHRSGFIALIGRPNVGKSTLLNALLGQKVSIVSKKPQTTRQRVQGILTLPTYQAIFIDTPGIHARPHLRIGERMVESAVSAIPEADIILFVVDVSVAPHEDDQRIAALLAGKAPECPVIFVLNKMDQLQLEEAEERIEAYWALLPSYADSMPTSATRGTNVLKLREHLVAQLPLGPRYYPHHQVTDQTDRQIAAELIREGVLRYTHQEVPHAAAVLINEYEEHENHVIYIDATLWVERESQKGIVIGKQGQMLKKIGAAARQQ